MKNLTEMGHVMEAIDLLKQTKGRKIPKWFVLLDYTMAGALIVCIAYAYFELITWIVAK